MFGCLKRHVEILQHACWSFATSCKTLPHMLTCDFCKIACWDRNMHVGICNMHVETRHLFLMNLPRSAWISVWIASLGARGSPSLSAWMVALGARGSPPFERMDGLPRSLGACGCALGHTDGLSLDHRQAARSCGPTCARCCGHMHHRRAQSARATARRRNAKGRNDQRVCIFVPELCCRGFSWRGFKNPNYFRPPII